MSCSQHGAERQPLRERCHRESFETLKYEQVYLFDYETFANVLERIPYFTEEVYNRKRLHSALGYLSPVNFEAPALISRNWE